MSQPPAGYDALPTSTAAAPVTTPAASAQQDGLPPGPPSSAGSMNQVLQANFLGVHRLKVKRIKGTEYTRQLSKVGVKSVKESIEARGWQSANSPYVLVPREQLPDGKQTVWNSDVLSSLEVYCLDGNHRLRALTIFYGGDFELECRCYLHFDDAIMVNALARNDVSPEYIAGVNSTTGATAKTTTYDRIFSCKKALEAIMAAENLGNDASKVTARMLSDAYKKSGDAPPSNPSLCSHERLVIGLKGLAFAALKEMSESEDKGVDMQSLPKTLLDCEAVLKFPFGRDFEQSLLIHILARFKSNDPGKKMPVKSDLPKLRQRALEAGDLHKHVTSVIPFYHWSPEFHKALFAIVYGRHTDRNTN
ncbi:unnamed protein product [Ectocarpus sp. CCAP 1310/34]|nr:unnamed protein product [Ectocarpus sp. CCAP 1310/34]